MTYREATLLLNRPDSAGRLLAGIVVEQMQNAVAVWETTAASDSHTVGRSAVYADAVAVMAWVQLA